MPYRGGSQLKPASPFTQNFIFMGFLFFFFFFFTNLGYGIYPNYSHPLLFIILLFNKSTLLPVNVCKIVGLVANSVDLDQTPCSATYDLGLHCLRRPVCPNA